MARPSRRWAPYGINVKYFATLLLTGAWVSLVQCEKAPVIEGQSDVVDDLDAASEVDVPPPPPHGTVQVEVGPLGMQALDSVSYAVIMRDASGALLAETRGLVAQDAEEDGAFSGELSCPLQPEGQDIDVHLILEGLNVGRPLVDGQDFFNPCAAEGDCTRRVSCVEGQIRTARFDMLVARRKEGGFFELGIEFGGMTCALDVSCKEALLFVDGARVRSHVVGFTCVGPPDLDLSLWMDDIGVDCGAGSTTLDAASAEGNQSAAGPVRMWANYRGREESLGNVKSFWNVAMAIAESDNCTLRTKATSSVTLFAEGRNPTGVRYPYGVVEVPIRGDSCEFVTEVSQGVTFGYTALTGDALCFGNRSVPSDAETASDTGCAN
jgi:hypothetical protein